MEIPCLKRGMELEGDIKKEDAAKTKKALVKRREKRNGKKIDFYANV